MAAETGVLTFLAFFQLAGALFLFRHGGPERRAYRLLAALLVLNATLSTWEALRAEGLTSERVAYVARLVDLPSAALLMAVAVSRTRVPHAALWTRVVLAAGALQLLAAVAAPQLVQSDWTPLQAIPYYVASSVLVVWTAFGHGWERWVSLAFLPRAFHFVAPGVTDLLLEGGWASGARLVEQLGLLVLLASCLIAVAALLLRPGSFRSAVILPVALVGPVLAAAQLAFVDAPPAAVAVHNWLSLGLVRPLFLYVGLCRPDLASIGSRTLACSGVAVASAFALFAGFRYPALPSWMVGISAGLLAFALLDATSPRGAGTGGGAVRRAGPGAPDDASEGSPVVGDVSARGRSIPVQGPAELPHWQRLLVELRGSSAQSGIGEPRYTQQDLARRTGISVKRVSEFPQALNATAAQKLAAHLPEWDDDGREAPTLVETHKGAVRGEPGARVYYRLTGVGEALAEQLAQNAAPEGASASDSGRNPLPPS